MLPDRSLQLLTAYVDGELSPRQRRLVERLLQSSPEARQLLRQLQQDAQQLQQLPRPTLPHDLSRPVLQTIVQRGLTPTQSAQVNQRRRVPFWRGVAAAAAVLLGLGLGSFWYFARPLPSSTNGELARGPEQVEPIPERTGDPLPLPDKVSLPEKVAQSPILPNPAKPIPSVKPETPAPAEKDRIAQKNKTPRKPPKVEPDPAPPRPSNGPVLTDRGMEQVNIKVVTREQLAPPLILDVSDLAQEAGRQKLLAELGKGPAFQLEFPVHQTTRAMERLQAACKTAGVHLTLDQLAQVRLKKPTVRTNYVCFLETTNPTDLVKLLQQFARIDRLAPTRKPPTESVLDRLVVARLDWGGLIDLLGPTIQAPPGQGNPGGLVVTLPPDRPSRSSPEVRTFLNNRKTAPAGALRVMIVLRSIG